MITRGDRRSLHLSKMRIETTWLKRHGKGQGQLASPGPISRNEWISIATPLLKMRKILLHCDGARAYKFSKVPGVLTTKVKHKRPHPIYVVRRLMYLPDDQRLVHVPLSKRPMRQRRRFSRIWVKTGTQIIDNVWRTFKTKSMRPTHLESSRVFAKHSGSIGTRRLTNGGPWATHFSIHIDHASGIVCESSPGVTIVTARIEVN